MTAKQKERRAKRIRQLYAEGMAAKEISKRYKLALDTVYAVLQNRIWIDAEYSPAARTQSGEFIGEILELRSKGKTFAEIGMTSGLKHRGKPFAANTISYALRSHNVLQRTDGSPSKATS